MFGRLLGWNTIYFFWGSCLPSEFCQVQNSLCVQVLRFPILAALLHSFIFSRSNLRGRRTALRGTFARMWECGVISQRELAVARPSVCLSCVCLLSVTLVHPTQAVVIFRNISTALGTLATRWHPLKILRRSSQGTPPPGELNTRGVANYSDFGPIDGYISATMQDRR